MVTKKTSPVSTTQKTSIEFLYESRTYRAVHKADETAPLLCVMSQDHFGNIYWEPINMMEEIDVMQALYGLIEAVATGKFTLKRGKE